MKKSDYFPAFWKGARLQRVFENQAGHVPATVDEKAAAMVDVLCLDVEVYCGKKANKKECPLPEIK